MTKQQLIEHFASMVAITTEEAVRRDDILEGAIWMAKAESWEQALKTLQYLEE